MTSVKEYYFEYDTFSNIVEIGIDKVSKAYLTSTGLEVALKISVYENSEIENNNINKLDKEVGITVFFLHVISIILYIKLINHLILSCY